MSKKNKLSSFQATVDPEPASDGEPEETGRGSCRKRNNL